MEVEHHMLGGVILNQIARGQNLILWILIKFGSMVLYNHTNLWTCSLIVCALLLFECVKCAILCLT